VSGGNKPAIKVAIKSRSGDGGRVSVCAAWRDDATGRLRASLDKRVVRMVLVLDDGSKVDVQRGADGKPTHFVDIFENEERGAAPQRQQQRSAGGSSLDDLLGGGPRRDPDPHRDVDVLGDLGADDIPF
jgi:hypothetical protein